MTHGLYSHCLAGFYSIMQVTGYEGSFGSLICTKIACLFVFQHLRVRCSEGAEFYTRSCTKVRGRMGHRFMFVDGDKAVSGSYRSVHITCVRRRENVSEKDYPLVLHLLLKLPTWHKR